MFERLKALHAKREQLAAEIQKLSENRDVENWAANWEKVNADYDANYAELQEVQAAWDAEKAAAVAVEQRLAAISNHASDSARLSIGRDDARIGDGGQTVQTAGQMQRAEAFGLALQAWCAVPCENADEIITDRHRAAARQVGININSANLTLAIGSTDQARAMANRLRFRNALSTQIAAAGGVLTDETFINRLELAMSAYGGMLQVAEIIRTPNANPLNWPTGDDTSNTGEQVGESTSVDGSTDPTFARQTWNAYKFSSKMVKVPFELLRDSPINIAGMIPDMLGERLGRIMNTKFTTGTGAATPYGIVPVSTAGVTSAASTAITTDELIDLEHKIDPSRRQMGCSWMFHDNVLKLFRKLKDGEGRYIWQAGMSGTASDAILGHPYTVNQDMSSTILTTNVTVLFGQLSAYKIRQVGSIRLRRLDERYAEYDQSAFIAFMEADGDLLDAGDHPVQKLTQV